MIRLELQIPIAFRLVAYAGIPALAFVSVALVWTELMLLPRFGTLDLQTKLSVVLMVPLLIAFFIWTFQIIRARHALSTCYVLTEEGIAVHAPHKAVQNVPWADIQSGTMQRFGKLLTLRSVRVEKPIVPMNNGGMYESSDLPAAFDLAVSKLGSRLETKWL